MELTDLYPSKGLFSLPKIENKTVDSFGIKFKNRMDNINGHKDTAVYTEMSIDNTDLIKLFNQ